MLGVRYKTLARRVKMSTTGCKVLMDTVQGIDSDMKCVVDRVEAVDDKVQGIDDEVQAIHGKSDDTNRSSFISFSYFSFRTLRSFRRKPNPR